VIRLSQVKGQRVIAHDTAQVLGSVRRLLLDPRSARIVAIELEGSADGRNIVEWPGITGIGPDALIVGSAEDRRGPLDETDQALIAGQLELEGKLVLDEAGDALGRLSDIAFDETTGQLIEIDVPGHAMPIDSVVAHGSYALIIPVSG
jgi:sporulation protein YlmC with PRC-barrel domain